MKRFTLLLTLFAALGAHPAHADGNEEIDIVYMFSVLFGNPDIMTEDYWIEANCTKEMKEYLRSEYETTYGDSTHYAGWLLVGQGDGEDSRKEVSKIELLNNKGRKAVAVHLDVFGYDVPMPSAYRTLVFDYEPSEYSFQISGVKWLPDVELAELRKDSNLSATQKKKLEELYGKYSSSLSNAELSYYDSETAHNIQIKRKRVLPGVGGTERLINIYGTNNAPEDSGCEGTPYLAMESTYYIEAAQFKEYDIVLYDNNDYKNVHPMMSFVTRNVRYKGKNATLEQTFCYDAEGNVEFTVENLISRDGKLLPLTKDVTVADGKAELLKGRKLVTVYNEMIGEH